MWVKRISILMTVSALLAVMIPSAHAQSAVTAAWDSSITYYTPDAGGGTLQIDYYSEDGTKYSADPIALSGNKAGSLYIGSVSSLPSSFGGSAVLSADVPIVATSVQFAAGAEAGSYGRALYSGFDSSRAATPFYVPTVLLNQFNTTSRVSVQNVESFEIAATLTFKEPGESDIVHTVDIPAQSAYIFMPDDIPGMRDPFNGSLVVEAHKEGDAATDGRIVAVSQEGHVSGRAAYAFEGVAGGSTGVYMASMLCNYRSENQISYYAIQNASTTSSATNVNITYYDTAGNQVGTDQKLGLGAGEKWSANPCAAGVADGLSGSAVIESTGEPLIAIGKVAADNGMVTSFLGEPSGHTKVAAPYIRWSSDPTAEFSAYIAVMNVGGSDATDIVARYYDGDGNLAGTDSVATAGDPLPNLIKANTTALDAGALDTNGNFGISPYGGAVEFESDQPIVVVVRLAKTVSLGSVTMFAEDYNGVPVQ
jgi:hypothetical protein